MKPTYYPVYYGLLGGSGFLGTAIVTKQQTTEDLRKKKLDIMGHTG